MLILMTINFQIFVLVRIPKGMGIFEKKKIGIDIRAGLLRTLSAQTKLSLDKEDADNENNGKDCDDRFQNAARLGAPEEPVSQPSEQMAINNFDLLLKESRESKQERRATLDAFQTKLREAQTLRNDNLRL